LFSGDETILPQSAVEMLDDR